DGFDPARDLRRFRPALLALHAAGRGDARARLRREQPRPGRVAPAAAQRTPPPAHEDLRLARIAALALQRGEDLEHGREGLAPERARDRRRAHARAPEGFLTRHSFRAERGASALLLALGRRLFL